MREGIESQIMNTAEEIDIYHWLNRTALELIGQGGLGYSFDPLIKVSKDTYADALTSMLYVSGSPDCVPPWLRNAPVPR